MPRSRLCGGLGTGSANISDKRWRAGLEKAMVALVLAADLVGSELVASDLVELGKGLVLVVLETSLQCQDI